MRQLFTTFLVFLNKSLLQIYFYYLQQQLLANSFTVKSLNGLIVFSLLSRIIIPVAFISIAGVHLLAAWIFLFQTDVL